jgi:hypothetical protein
LADVEIHEGLAASVAVAGGASRDLERRLAADGERADVDAGGGGGGAMAAVRPRNAAAVTVAMRCAVRMDFNVVIRGPFEDTSPSAGTGS